MIHFHLEEEGRERQRRQRASGEERGKRGRKGAKRGKERMVNSSINKPPLFFVFPSGGRCDSSYILRNFLF